MQVHVHALRQEGCGPAAFQEVLLFHRLYLCALALPPFACIQGGCSLFSGFQRCHLTI